ncbi:GNAT family N-acetyltransferase [Piscibacillus halophilus]|uniref:Predicted N-acetyltransferase YhbS n=1 Tax=Piscibacillus halophilus TaxID=571933 RepID=A0A1H9DHD9_9BACI|nr:GNAT family N-acetyltransferase [Piscibacillus halophilus]SEQ12819.1 Predicted N-acetyltransferase YhbS [Piscibacillus halophilus]
MVDINLRDANPSEIPIIRKHRLKAYQEYSKVLNDSHWEVLSGTLSSEADLEPGVDIMVAESKDGEVLGSVVLFPAKSMAYGEWTDALDYPELRMLAVSPEARGQGIAYKLVNECIKRTKERGFGQLGLHTGSFMKGAIKLYERLGFERIPEHDFEPANDGIIVKAYVLNIK